ncbi:DUF2020 domain-containing protein [Nakamurella sp.]|uniref:DUF2020 domain-containing protein n=1 Tax=Nakamurella sp. TaxID=1869182 RepID=UPI003B3A0114
MHATGSRGRLHRGAVAALAGLLTAGCAGAGAASAPSAPAAPTITVTAGTRTATLSVTVTAEPASVPPAAPPAATDEPAAQAGPCPYLSDDQVADINGQHTGTTTIVAVDPHPICTFTRSDGGWLATVRIVQADSAAAAAAAVDQHVPVEKSDPADDPVGWTGGSMPTDRGSVYAVAKGQVAVIAEANQPQSIKGRQLAAAAIANLGL